MACILFKFKTFSLVLSQTNLFISEKISDSEIHSIGVQIKKGTKPNKKTFTRENIEAFAEISKRNKNSEDTDEDWTHNITGTIKLQIQYPNL